MSKIFLIPVVVLLCMPLFLGCSRPDTTMVKPDVLLIVVDSFRNDHLSCNGYHRSTTPVMDSLASQGCIWREAQAQSSWTMPSMASILTGLPQRVHRAGFDQGLLYGLDPLLPTLPMLLQRRAGYRSAGFFGSIYISEAFGFHHEFDYFNCEQSPMGGRMRTATETVQCFLNWYDTNRETDHPLMAVLHFNDPRLPYSPPSPWDTLFTTDDYAGRFNSAWGSFSDIVSMQLQGNRPDSADILNLTSLYDGEIAYVDHEIGRLIHELRDRNGIENTVFIVTGTSGEELGDHGGIGNGHTLYQEILRIPLIISGYGIDPCEETMVASQIDILPTVLSICGVDQPLWSKGEVLLGPSATVYTREIPSSNLYGDVPQMGSVRLGGTIVIGDIVEYSFLQFDINADPGQVSMLQPTSDFVDKLLIYWSSPVNGHPQSAYSRECMMEHYRNNGLFAGSIGNHCLVTAREILCKESERGR